MATRRADWESVVQRCRDAGWTVTEVPDGYKVYPANRDEFAQVIHKSVSDSGAMRLLIKDLERKGLKEDELRVKTERTAARRAKIAADRAANNRRAAEIAATKATHKTLVSKAAGPYLVEPEDCDLEWMIKPHPAPWMRWMYVTAPAAEKVLADANSDNRAISPAEVERDKQIMLSGQWRLTHQGIAFDTRGLLQDGQHRYSALQAMLELVDRKDVTIPFDPHKGLPFAVFVGMPVENFKAIDEGRLRTAQQMLAKAGVFNSGHVTTCLRAIAAFDSGNPAGYFKGRKLTSAAAFQGLSVDQETIEAAVRYGTRQYRSTLVTPGVFGAAYYLIGRANGFDNPYVEAFFEGFVHNRKFNTDRVLPDDDPRNTLLRRVTANHRSMRGKTTKPATPVEVVGWIIRAWNNLAEGNHTQYLKAYNLADTPRILVCKPDHGVPPRALLGEV